MIRKVLKDGSIPVISPLALDEAGLYYNTNADSAACKVAYRTSDYELDNTDSLISSLHIEQVDELIDNNVISSGMIPKVESAKYALINGVKRVHLIHAEQSHSLLLEIFTDQGIGTEIINP